MAIDLRELAKGISAAAQSIANPLLQHYQNLEEAELQRKLMEDRLNLEQKLAEESWQKQWGIQKEYYDKKAEEDFNRQVLAKFDPRLIPTLKKVAAGDLDASNSLNLVSDAVKRIRTEYVFPKDVAGKIKDPMLIDYLTDEYQQTMMKKYEIDTRAEYLRAREEEKSEKRTNEFLKPRREQDRLIEQDLDKIEKEIIKNEGILELAKAGLEEAQSLYETEQNDKNKTQLKVAIAQHKKQLTAAQENLRRLQEQKSELLNKKLTNRGVQSELPKTEQVDIPVPNPELAKELEKASSSFDKATTAEQLNPYQLTDKDIPAGVDRAEFEKYYWATIQEKGFDISKERAIALTKKFLNSIKGK